MKERCDEWEPLSHVNHEHHLNYAGHLQLSYSQYLFKSETDLTLKSSFSLHRLLWTC